MTGPVPPVTGYRCAVCGAAVGIAEPFPWRCPRATEHDRHHVLQIQGGGGVEGVDAVAVNPFVAFGARLAWRSFAAAHGMDSTACDELTLELDRAVAAVAGVGFRWTPFGRADALSDALGFTSDGGVWVKDETGNVSGSHKARHLLSIGLQLLAAEVLGLVPWGGAAGRPALAIASCGNAALAAGVLAAAMAWPIEVFVPPWANRQVTERLASLGASIVVCPRRPEDAPGDPCVRRFREAVSAGAIPFAVQGPENALCLDGGRTIGWEMGVRLSGGHAAVGLHHLFVQVGGGALAACAARGLGEVGALPAVHAVQAEGCAPLARAWDLASALGVERAPGRWDECMWAWETEPTSAATGILDDETYDWIGIVQAMARSCGGAVVAPEAVVVEANELARRTTGVDVDHTGTAGLAGLIAVRSEVADHERVAVIFSGRRR